MVVSTQMYIGSGFRFSYILSDKKNCKGIAALGLDVDIKKMVKNIQDSPIGLDLDEVCLELDLIKNSSQDIEEVLQQLSVLGLVEIKRKEHKQCLDVTLKRLKHFREVELERDKLGYWGQDKLAPRYSICVCNYNMADTLERAMTSVLDQLDAKLYEVVVIDDGSSDGSLAELGKLAKRYPNFRYVALPRDPKRKLGETRNISIRAARGEYVLLHIDADDQWEPYLHDFVTLFHKIEKAAGQDVHLSGQQTGIGKRDLLLKYGPFANLYRCEDRNLMMKLAKHNVILFLDYRVYRTRMTRPLRKKIIKCVWDDCSHMVYDFRQNEPKLPFIRQAFEKPFAGKNASLISKFTFPALIFPIYLLTRFMPPIINQISREEMRAYHQKNRGNYAQVMERLGGDPDISFLSEDSQAIYSYEIKHLGFKSIE